MFTSKEYLHISLGLDYNIAKFFVDRKLPVNNRYWQGRYLYVAQGTGYLFIPLFFDLQFKCGVSSESLLNEKYVCLTEGILHSAALYEFEEITFQEHLENCIKLLDNKINNYGLYNALLVYFADGTLKPYKNLGTASKALNRGDTLLFSVCYLHLNEEVTCKVLEAWYALVPSFLLMDDISDLQLDRKNRQENSINDFGKGSEGVANALNFLQMKFNLLKTYNLKLGSHLENSLQKKLQTPYIQSLLNNN